jgi:hypothetical protein
MASLLDETLAEEEAADKLLGGSGHLRQTFDLRNQLTLTFCSGLYLLRDSAAGAVLGFPEGALIAGR